MFYLNTKSLPIKKNVLAYTYLNQKKNQTNLNLNKIFKQFLLTNFENFLESNDRNTVT